ncbi:SPOR domain-containing protein [Ekhidna sp. To15]|uniref:SPOR domain-containing protein n=1 Tax=Ekhidna sp. To15 TaxID=3395267 RepID=UPI003F51C0C4
MAKDDNTNDKDQDDFFGDDEDFGLPELDYEALDDDDSDSSEEEKVEEPAAEEPPVEEPSVEEPKEKELVAEDDSMMDEDDSMMDMDSFDDEEIPDQISDEELEASMTDDDSLDDISMDDAFEDDDSMDDSFDDSSMDDAFDEAGAEEEASADADDTSSKEEVDDFYEEESFDDFEESSEGSDEEIPDSVFDSDVLDEDEFAQFEKELMDTEEENVADVDDFQSDYSEPAPAESKSKFARVVVIGILIFAALGTIFMLAADPFGDEGETEAVAEKPTPKPVAKTPEKKQEEKPASSTAEPETSSATNTGNQSNTGSQTNRPAAQPQTVASNPGTINSLSARTGNFFIVIGSFLDGDMAMDYASKLSGQGKSPSIIPPFGNAVTHRVAIAGYSSLADSQRAVDGFKAEYGDDIWILKY